MCEKCVLIKKTAKTMSDLERVKRKTELATSMFLDLSIDLDIKGMEGQRLALHTLLDKSLDLQHDINCMTNKLRDMQIADLGKDFDN